MAQEFHSSTHPPLPPTTEDEQLSWLRLLRSRRVGISTFYRLMADHGSANAALAALPDIATAAGVQSYAVWSEEAALGELRAGRKAGARLVAIGTPDYPMALADLDDAPPLLWVKGQTQILSRPVIAMVGARNASSLGTRMARGLAQDLAERGFVIVSGLARGVDTAAHKSTVTSGTIAVMAGGVDVIYPSENTALAAEIEKNGLRISEQPIGVTPQARHFPHRNRLISGLARAVVVIEAAAKSGSLITAKNALDQGREVLAVPGHPFDARASGCNMLIRDGARLVRNADDVIEALGPISNPTQSQQCLALEPTPPPVPSADTHSPSPKKRTLRETAALHKQILDRLGPSPIAEDQLIRDLHSPAHAVAPVLLDLELDGQITRQSGGMLSLAPEAKRG
ncbi:DNA-processing protein DprA [Alisedimentitalea sp. MJ-SS2]|uniref:DNA-processing protein DprA n=1 Tax=Aliisedimentitalea sp. MJ-SS2 TaxID=3049795 RepID=UPI0029112DA5|nr:DNA-processing protein DprA [Alisedimentitalea sp. MJ-SS2]MDU8926105.1 DNA-processing protein DprA [Alisedimentitalea sp. MJ-SS2]